MRIGSLFSGAGGLDLAVEQVFDATTAWHCEVDPAASKVLAHRWPGVPNLGDITAIDWERGLAWKKRGEAPSVAVDIICGGWPCQPFSLAGQRKGSADERALWSHVARAVRILRPRIVVLENVSAVLGPEFSRVADDLATCGYDIAWTCLRASDVGAPHRRERLFILAADTSGGAFGQQSISQPRGERATLLGLHHGATAQSARDGRHEGRPEPARIKRGSDAAVSCDGSVALLPTPTTQDAANCAGPSQFNRNTPPLNVVATLLPTPAASDGNGGKASKVSGGTRVSGQKRSVPLTDIPHFIPAWGKYEPAIRRWETLTRPAPAPTEPNAKGNPRLAAAFSEWLMGWPPGWVTDVPGISRNDALRIIGNGVVPQQAIAALRWLLAVAQQAA